MSPIYSGEGDTPSEEVCGLPNSCHLFRKPNKAGGYTYYSDEIGGGVEVWDTSLVDQSTLLCAMAEEAKREMLAAHEQEMRDRDALAQFEAIRDEQYEQDRRDRCGYCGTDAYNGIERDDEGKTILAPGVHVDAQAEIKKVLDYQAKLGVVGPRSPAFQIGDQVEVWFTTMGKIDHFEIGRVIGIRSENYQNHVYRVRFNYIDPIEVPESRLAVHASSSPGFTRVSLLDTQIPIFSVGDTIWAEQPGRIEGQVVTVLKASGEGSFYTIELINGDAMMVDWPYVSRNKMTPAKTWWRP